MHSMQLGQQTCRSNGHSSAQPCTFARPVQTAWHRTCLANTLHQCHNTVRKDERSAVTAYCTNKLRIRHYVKLEPTVGFIIEVLKGSDANGIAALVALEKRIFTKSDSWAEMIEKEVKKRNCLALVAKDSSGQVLAYVLCTSSGINLHVSKIAVRQDCRRMGIGRALMQACLTAAAKERRALSSSLHVAQDNAPAVALYKSLGYNEDGVLHDYYKPGRHALKMMADLERLGLR